MQGLSIVPIILVLVTSASPFLWFADKYIWLPSWYFHLAASKTCYARSLSQTVLSPHPPPPPGPSLVFLVLVSLTTIHLAVQARNDDSLKTSPLLTSHILIISEIYALFSVFPTTTLSSPRLSPGRAVTVSWSISLHPPHPLLPHSPHCSLSELFKMQSKLFTPWWKLGDFSLPVRAKPNSVNSHSTPGWSGPHPLKPPHTTLTLYFLCVHPADLSTPPRHSRLLHSHFSAYNSFPLLFI